MALSKIGASIVLEGEKEYRQALKSITSDQKELKSEMQLCSATYAESQNSIEALTSKYEILNKQLEQQQKKVDVYAQALEAAQSRQSDSASAVEQYTKELESAEAELEKMKASGTATNEELKAQELVVESLKGKLEESESAYEKNTASVTSWQTGLNNAQAGLIGIQNDIGKTNGYLDEAKKSTDGCATSIDEYGKKTQDASQSTLNFGDVLKANVASEAIVKGFEKLAELTGQVAEGLLDMATNAAFFADDVKTLSTQTGVATDTIQALYYSEQLLDVSVQTVTGSMAKNIRAMNSAASGSATYASAYNKIGVAVANADGSLRDSEQVFWEVIDALGEMDNATERDAVAMQIFGKSAQSLNTLIEAGSDGFNELKEEAADLGYILEEDTIDSLVGASDAMERLSKAGDTVKNAIGAELADTVTNAASEIEEAILANKDELVEIVSKVIPPLVDGLTSIIEHADEIIPVVAGMTAGFIAFKAGTAIVTGVSAVMSALQLATEGATVAQLALNVAQNAAPWGWIATAIGGVVAALGLLVSNTKTAQSANEELIKTNNQIIEQEREYLSARQETESSRESEQATIENLKNELLKLNEQEVLTNDEQARMSTIVNELNSAMPDLNLALDEETGHLNATNAEIEKQIENRQQMLLLQAAEADLTEIANEMYEAEKAKTEMLNQQASAWENVTHWENLYKEALSTGAETTYIDGVNYSLEGLKTQYDTAVASAQTFDSQVQQQEGILASLQTEYNSVSSTMDGYQNEINDTSTALENQASQTILWRDRFVTLSGDTANALDELNAKYAEAKQAAEESLGGQISLFEELSGESDLSVQEMATHLQSQTDTMNQYADDMTKAMELVEEGMMDEGLLGSIKEMGIDGAGYLHELVTAAEEDTEAYQEVMDAWSDQQAAFDNLSGQFAEFETDYSNKMDELVIDTLQADTQINDDVTTTMNGLVVVAGQAVTDMAEAIVFGFAGVHDASTTVAEGAVSASQDVFGIDDSGTSATGIGLGETFASGIKGGIEAQRESLVDAVNSVMQSAIDAANAKAAELNRALGGAMD